MATKSCEATTNRRTRKRGYELSQGKPKRSPDEAGQSQDSADAGYTASRDKMPASVRDLPANTDIMVTFATGSVAELV